MKIRALAVLITSVALGTFAYAGVGGVAKTTGRVTGKATEKTAHGAVKAGKDTAKAGSTAGKDTAKAGKGIEKGVKGIGHVL